MVPAASPRAARGHKLAFKNLHTGESLTTAYRVDGQHLPEASRRIDWLLRDHRTGEVAPISVQLLDALYDLRDRLGTEAPFEVISGYRSPKTNAVLANAGSGVARRSLHMRGMAIDIRVPGRSLRRLRTAAVALKAGGVGFYPKSGFIHLDVGRVRYW
jgi:uncharacterized protein YcbK (DUF882 family)